MNVKLFIGLTFYPENSFAKKVESFRQRFDEKYQSTPYLHLPIVPSFEIDVTDVKKLKGELIEELESFYFDNIKHHSLKFSGFDVHEYKKKKLLYLNPIVEEELRLCQESLFSICRSYLNDREKRIKDDKKPFLTIGRFHELGGLHSTIELARSEFQEFTSLPFQSICLFSQNHGIWYRESDLISFERPVDTFLHSSQVAI